MNDEWIFKTGALAGIGVIGIIILITAIILLVVK